MKQHEAVILTLEKLGGQATLSELYIEVMKVTDCSWKTKTPYASIRRIVQARPEIFKVRPGLYALRSFQQKLNLVEENSNNAQEPEVIEQNHSYYQGLLVSIGNFRKLKTFVPNQDKNKLFLGKPLGTYRSLSNIPNFGYEMFVKRSSTVDVIWFNQRDMPQSFFEVEHSTDIQNALLKFVDLQDYFCKMVIVASADRKKEFEKKLNYAAFVDIRQRISFLNYEAVVKTYDIEVFKSNLEFSL